MFRLNYMRWSCFYQNQIWCVLFSLLWSVSFFVVLRSYPFRFSLPFRWSIDVNSTRMFITSSHWYALPFIQVKVKVFNSSSVWFAFQSPTISISLVIHVYIWIFFPCSSILCRCRSYFSNLRRICGFLRYLLEFWRSIDVNGTGMFTTSVDLSTVLFFQVGIKGFKGSFYKLSYYLN